ncbi:hypothetical protein B0H16DRAFT_1260489, partial [Mycena metata]
QGPGFRWDTLDDYWGYWNWVKLTILGTNLFFPCLDVECAQQTEVFKLFSEQQQERIPVWKKMVEDFEAQQELGPDAELAEGRLQFAAEEAQRAELGVPVLHNVSPSSFIYAGLALEEEQYHVRIEAELKKAKATGQQISLTGIRTKLTRGIQRFRRLQAVYTPAALQAAATCTTPDMSELPEDKPLFMLSAL